MSGEAVHVTFHSFILGFDAAPSVPSGETEPRLHAPLKKGPVCAAFKPWLISPDWFHSMFFHRLRIIERNCATMTMVHAGGLPIRT
jgi:hypothetical protein